MEKVLFICEHNQARSQMAEAIFNRLAGEGYQAESAGLEPTQVHPLTVAAMKEQGVDLTGKATQSVFELYKNGRLYSHVITVCRPEVDAKCPVFPGLTSRENWNLDDPADVEGSEEDKLEAFRKTRALVEERVAAWLEARKG
ncbi:MAG: arsenate reductase ArsC [Desulfovibrionaceae bacterium]